MPYKELQRLIYKIINDFKENTNKHFYKLRKTRQGMKKQFNKDMEILKKNRIMEKKSIEQIKTQWKVSPIDNIKQKTQFQSLRIWLRNYCTDTEKEKITNDEQNIQDFWDMIKKQNVKKLLKRHKYTVKTNDIKKLIKQKTENFPNLGKAITTQVQEALRTPNRHDQKRTPHITV